MEEGASGSISGADCTHGFKSSMPKFQLARRHKGKLLARGGKVVMTSKRNNISNKEFKMAKVRV